MQSTIVEPTLCCDKVFIDLMHYAGTVGVTSLLLWLIGHAVSFFASVLNAVKSSLKRVEHLQSGWAPSQPYRAVTVLEQQEAGPNINMDLVAHQGSPVLHRSRGRCRSTCFQFIMCIPYSTTIQQKLNFGIHK